MFPSLLSSRKTISTCAGPLRRRYWTRSPLGSDPDAGRSTLRTRYDLYRYEVGRNMMHGVLSSTNTAERGTVKKSDRVVTQRGVE